jgi:hypothetical protein
MGADGSRVPLLRSGFRPNGPYEVSFVFQHAGAPFAKKGGSDLTLPKMDVPISLMQWEVFLPQQYKVKDFSGDVIAANLVPVSPFAYEGAIEVETRSGTNSYRGISLLTGQIGGYVTDPNGAALPNAQVKVEQLDYGVTRTVNTDANGKWVVSSIPSGRVKITASSNGFNATVREGGYEADRPAEVDSALQLGTVSQTVTVTAQIQNLDMMSADVATSQHGKKVKQQEQAQNAAPSSNVTTLQRKVAGVLPVAVDVPRAGTSYSFVRPLVIDEETKLTFAYKTK